MQSWERAAFVPNPILNSDGDFRLAGATQNVVKL